MTSFPWHTICYITSRDMVTPLTIPKDLAKEPPRSPRVRIGGYALLARMADKGRATLNETVGDYHFNCPLDNMLFGFKCVSGEDVMQLLASGASDEEIAGWLDTHGAPKTRAEVEAWSNFVETLHPYDNPKHRVWFTEKCAKLGLKPETTTAFDLLEADDHASFQS
jgi:hypothetical protein